MNGPTVAISQVKNEADIIVPSVLHMLNQAHFVIVADNGSTDETRFLLDDLAAEWGRLVVVDRPEVGYYQSKAMTALAAMAFDDFEAEWIIPFDADELWFSRDDRRIADVLEELPPNFLTAHADVWDHVATAHDPADAPNPFFRLGFRRQKPLPLPKVACRYRDGMVIEQGNHAVTYPNQPYFAGVAVNLLTIRHFPYRSPEQFIEKVRVGAAAYAATDLPQSVGAHWRQWGAILEGQGEDAVREIFFKWFWRDNPLGEIEIDGEHQPPLVWDSPTGFGLEAVAEEALDG